MMKDENYVLVKLTNEKGQEFYGTINHEEINESGYLRRQLNGFDMCLSGTIESAIQLRKDEQATRNMNEEQIFNYFKTKLGRA